MKTFRCVDVLPIMALEGCKTPVRAALQFPLIQCGVEDDSFDPKHTVGYIKALLGLLASKKE